METDGRGVPVEGVPLSPEFAANAPGASTGGVSGGEAAEP